MTYTPEALNEKQLQGVFHAITAARDLQRAFDSAGLGEYTHAIAQIINELEQRKTAAYAAMRKPAPGEVFNLNATPYTGPKA